MLELSLLQNKYTVDLKTSYKSMSVKRSFACSSFTFNGTQSIIFIRFQAAL